MNGRLDAANREAVRTRLHDLVAGPAATIVVNLENVPFIDSSGLSALVSGLRAAREQHKDIILIKLNKQAEMVFNLTMMDRVFSIFPSVQLALDSLPD